MYILIFGQLTQFAEKVVFLQSFNNLCWALVIVFQEGFTRKVFKHSFYTVQTHLFKSPFDRIDSSGQKGRKFGSYSIGRMLQLAEYDWPKTSIG
jgi:hypothetical protein